MGAGDSAAAPSAPDCGEASASANPSYQDGRACGDRASSTYKHHPSANTSSKPSASAADCPSATRPGSHAPSASTGGAASSCANPCSSHQVLLCGMRRPLNFC